MRGDRHIFSHPPLYFVLSPYYHPITSSPPQSSPVFKIKDIVTIHTEKILRAHWLEKCRRYACSAG